MNISEFLTDGCNSKYQELKPDHESLDWESFHNGWVEGRFPLMPPTLQWEKQWSPLVDADCYYSCTEIAEYQLSPYGDGEWEYFHKTLNDQLEINVPSLERAIKKAQAHFESLLANPLGLDPANQESK